MGIGAIREIGVPGDDVHAVLRRVSARPRAWRWAMSALGWDQLTSRPLRDVRSAASEQAAARISRLTALRLLHRGSVDVGGTRLRLKALPTDAPPVPDQALLGADMEVGWPDAGSAPRVSSATWDRARSGSARDLASVRRAVAELSMELSQDDVARLVDLGAVFTNASWSRIKAYVVHAHDGGAAVFFTVSSSPPLDAPMGGG